MTRKGGDGDSVMAEDPAATDKAAAFEEARRKFAAYSRVSSGRVVASSATVPRLRTTASLQVNGELAAQLADVDYHLAGILDASPRRNGANNALATSVVELTSLLRSRELRAVLLSSRTDSSGDVCARIRQVLRLLLPPHRQDPSAAEGRSAENGGDKGAGTTSGLLRLCVSVLAYSLTLDADAAAVLVDERTFAAVVGALKAEMEAIAIDQSDVDAHAVTPTTGATGERSDLSLAATVACDHKGDAATMQGPTRDVKLPLRRTCLKRKRTGAESTVSCEDSVATPDNDLPTEKQAFDDGGAPGRDRSESSDAAVRARLHALVAGDTAFVVANGRVSLSTTDVLCAILHNLLQIESPADSNAPGPQEARVVSRPEDHDAEPSSMESSKQLHPEQRQSGVVVSLDQRSGVHAAFRAARDRKAWLVRSGALDTLVHALQLRLAPLVDLVDLMHPESNGIRALSEECDQADVEARQSALHRLGAVLQVLEQAAFFASNVQRRLSTNRELFVMLLAIIRVLGDACWGSDLLWASSSTRECATEAVDVFLAAMRLLINLTHQNAAADAHMSCLDGMCVLFDMFCHVWHLVEGTPGIDAPRSTQGVDGPSSCTRQSVVIEDKLVFDAYLLLLSAMANCVENSEENRRALSRLTPPVRAMAGGGKSPASVCSLLTQFFLAKVQSCIQLIDDSHDATGGPSDDADADWSPDDVILGGCCALLLGCLMSDSSDNVSAVLTRLPGQSPRLLIRALAVFVALHAQIGALTPEVAASVLRVETALKGILLQVADQARPQGGGAAAFGAAHAITHPSDQEVDDVKATTPSRSDIMSPDRATPVKDSKSSGASPSPARAAQRRRNLYASLSDSDDESGARGKNGSSVALGGSDSSHHQDGDANSGIGTAGRAPGSEWSSPAPKSPSLPRLSRRSPPSGFRTPSPSRRKKPAKSSERRQSRGSSVVSVGSTSRRLLKEARSLINDLDAEFARASGTPAATSDRSVQPLVSNTVTSLGHTSGEYWSRDQDEDGDGERTSTVTSVPAVVSGYSVVELVESDDSPAPAKKTEKKRKRKDYRLPTSPFRRVGRPTASGEHRSGVRAIFQQSTVIDNDASPSTPVRNKAVTPQLRQARLPVDFGMQESPIGESPARRKAKSARAAPSPLAAAIFDFDE